jgi:hypothetical protein
MWPSVFRVFEPFSGLMVFCIQCSSNWKYFQCKDKFSQQKEGLAMGNSLSLVVSNMSIEHFEEIA